jgi:hypothetical protein
MGGGGVVGYCDAGLNCGAAGGCSADVNGGTCVAVADLVWVLPMAGERFAPDASVTLRVRATQADGGDLARSSLEFNSNFTARSQLPRVNAFYEAVENVGVGGSARTATVWLDGGPSKTIAFVMDDQGPGFTVTSLTPQYYGDGGADFIPFDPGLPVAYRKDETLLVEVRSGADDVDVTSVRLNASIDGGTALTAIPVNFCDGGTGFCQVLGVDLSRVELNDFRGKVDLVATGRDVRANGGTGSLPVNVTRWQWAKRVQVGGTTHALKATPAIGAGGRLYLGATAVGTGGLVAVEADGGTAWVIADGPVAGSPSVGLDNANNQLIFYQATIGTFATLKAARPAGTTVGQTCATASTGLSEGSLAVMNDGTGNVLGFGIQPNSSATNQRVNALRPGTSSCITDAIGGLPAAPFPTGVVASGTSGYYVGSDRTMRSFDIAGVVTPSLVSHSAITSGAANGLVVLGTDRILGAGGAAGQGQLFLANATTTGSNIWSAPVSNGASGPVTIDGGLVSVISVANQAQVVVLHPADGGELARSRVLTSSAFTNAQIPTPVAGEGGKLYVADEEGRLFVLAQSTIVDGGSTWPPVVLPAGVSGPVSSSLSLDCNRRLPSSQSGILYIATESGWLVSYIVDSKGLDPTAPWPKYQRDARNTGNLAGPAIACP